MFSKSDISIIGYDSISEDLKDKLLDKLNVFRLGKINEEFTIKSYIRDLKISSILENSSINLPNDIIHLDISDVEVEISDSFSRSKKVHNLIETIRGELFTCNFKCIVTTKTYKSFDKTVNYRGGNRILYPVDFAIILQNKSAKVIKSIYDLDNIDIDISDLKNFNYICDYESNK
jgi:hypothetical protein